MQVAPAPHTERERLTALHEYSILDTMQDAHYDFITSLAAKTCFTSASFTGFIDTNRLWLKSANGLQGAEISHAVSISDAAIKNPREVFVINNINENARVKDYTFTDNGKPILFYAGAPIVNDEGHVLGILGVVDYTRNNLTTEQRETLLALAKQLVALLELGKAKHELRQKNAELKMAFSDIENIAYIASHDLKTPINNVVSLAHLIKEQYGEAIGEEGAEYVNFINEASYYLSDMVKGIHSYSKAARLPVEDYEKINTAELIDEVVAALTTPENCTLNYNVGVPEIVVAKAALKQVLLLLTLNAIQYNDKERGTVSISITEDASHYVFEISDTGEGIAERDYELMFEMFKRLRERDKTGENMGMGLAIVKRLVEKMKGTVSVKSEVGNGASFSFSLPKHTI